MVDRIEKSVVGCFIAVIFVKVAILAAVVWVIVHFLSKLW